MTFIKPVRRAVGNVATVMYFEEDAALRRIAHRHGFSTSATRLMCTALEQGHGTLAQFDHPEFGGFGQWTRGAASVVSCAGDRALETRIDALCRELVDLADTPTTVRPRGR